MTTPTKRIVIAVTVPADADKNHLADLVGYRFGEDYADEQVEPDTTVWDSAEDFVKDYNEGGPEVSATAEITDDAVAFFAENGALSYNPATETPEEGRQRGARASALAEARAKLAGADFTWSDDWAVGDHAAEYDCYADGGPSTCESVIMRVNGLVVASMGCVDDATDSYRRVIEADLAEEWLAASPA